MTFHNGTEVRSPESVGGPLHGHAMTVQHFWSSMTNPALPEMLRGHYPIHTKFLYIHSGQKWYWFLSSVLSISLSDFICSAEIESRQRTTKKKMKVDKTNEMSYRDLNIRRLYLGEEPFRDGGHQRFDVPASKRPKSWNLHVQLNISFTIRYVTFTSREFWDY